MRRTALYDFHVKHGGKMVDFAGWSLPVQYNDVGIIDSCLHTRSKASLFDVSHMGQLEITGKDRVRFIESLVVGDVGGLRVGEGRLSVFTTDSGGILDDAIITRKQDSVNVVLNAGRVHVDMKHIEHARSMFHGDVSLCLHKAKSLIALQGPSAAEILETLLKEEHNNKPFPLQRLPFMCSVDLAVAGQSGCQISRSGYTGEDGFEISIPTDSSAVHIAEAIMNAGQDSVKLAGLGARDTLRIEAGLCLYGSDIDENVTPVEAGLSWTISKVRRDPNGVNGFPGFKRILEQLSNGVNRKRVGFTILNGPPARHGNLVHRPSDMDRPIGEVTSGTFSPSLAKSVAMGYVPIQHARSGTELLVNVRGKLNPVVVTKMPFVQSNYYKGLVK